MSQKTQTNIFLSTGKNCSARMSVIFNHRKPCLRAHTNMTTRKMGYYEDHAEE